MLEFEVSMTDTARKVHAAENFIPGVQRVPLLKQSGDSGVELEFRMDLARASFAVEASTTR
jgi:hypothetical protein